MDEQIKLEIETFVSQSDFHELKSSSSDVQMNGSFTDKITKEQFEKLA